MLTESSRQLRAQHLDRHLPAMLHVLGEIHGRHLDTVAVGEGDAQAINLLGLVGHGTALLRGASIRCGLTREWASLQAE
jgi:hypothetical protein